ncbi:MAG TPA: LptA/OstA family protein [Tepidisphaeraceae bacterium]|nr:LptA/OstA family protein [Tepidisphaeraceae bacterium]
MTQPPTNNSTDSASDDRSDADWARWAQTFRDARPVLPEAAMQRIEDGMRREMAQRPATRMNRKLSILVIIAIVLIGAAAAEWFISHHQAPPAPLVIRNTPATPRVRDEYPLDVPFGPQLIAPDQPILQLAENADLIGEAESRSDHARPSPPRPAVPSPASQPSALASPLLRAAARVAGEPPDGWHALGLLEMRRAAGVAAPLPQAVPPGVVEFHLDACWRMLPLPADRADALKAPLQSLRKEDGQASSQFWPSDFQLYSAMKTGKSQPPPDLAFAGAVGTFPSRAGEQARFDMLVELGTPKAQAALAVMTSRSYRPLLALRELDRWQGAAACRDRLRDGYLAAAHDLVERVFALRLLGRDRDADALLAKARQIRYLNDPRDLAVLLARLGPANAWTQLLQPLMRDEAGFIQNPPNLDQISPAIPARAIVQADAKSTQEGVGVYTGHVTINAGPWKLACDKLTAFRGSEQGTLLSAAGHIHITGILGLMGGTADEATFDTATGELKLAGHVRLETWEHAVELKSCSISRTGEVRNQMR